MRVLLDATAIPADRGGVGRYVDELVPELTRAGVDLVIAAQSRDADLFAELAPDAEVIAIDPRYASVPLRMAWEQVGLPRLIHQVRPDVVHSPHYTMPLAARLPTPAARTGVPVVVTAHDATFFTNPELHLGSKAAFFKTATRVATHGAAAIVVPSEATRNEIVRLTGANPKQFHVAFHGVDRERFHPVSADDIARVRRTLDINAGGYVAFLGTLEPRKNVPNLIRGWVSACEWFRERMRPVPAPNLVLAGGAGWDHEIDDVIAQVPDYLTVRRTGYLPLGDLPGFLAGADVVAYPSLGEGFGLPVLEAMACGACVLTTRRLSLPEVGGDAVAYCDVDAKSIGEALVELLSDPARRRELATAALARAETFTWANAAAEHVKAYEAAIQRAKAK